MGVVILTLLCIRAGRVHSLYMSGTIVSSVYWFSGVCDLFHVALCAETISVSNPMLRGYDLFSRRQPAH